MLICDDSKAMRTLLSLIVQTRQGLSVAGEARDGEEAVAQARRLQPDVVLLDLAMPRRTGFDALPEIRQVAPSAQVIVLSGFIAATIEADVLALGAARFIDKGTDPETVLDAIHEVAMAWRAAHASLDAGAFPLRRPNAA